jgi:hypothetical protein
MAVDLSHPDWDAIRTEYERLDAGTAYLRLRSYRRRRVQALRDPDRRDGDGTPLDHIDGVLAILRDVVGSARFSAIEIDLLVAS